LTIFFNYVNNSRAAKRIIKDARFVRFDLAMEGKMILEERRDAKRFRSRIALVFHDGEGLNFSFISDMSRSGLYLETERLLEPGSTVDFVLSNSVSKAPVVGRVMRVRNSLFEGPPSGMGIKFEKMDEMGRIIRDDMLLYLMNLRYQKMWVKESLNAA
jgi:Tfp pilus assembly protein PilZ